MNRPRWFFLLDILIAIFFFLTVIPGLAWWAGGGCR
jgi:hypothetical protein